MATTYQIINSSSIHGPSSTYITLYHNVKTQNTSGMYSRYSVYTEKIQLIHIGVSVTEVFLMQQTAWNTWRKFSLGTNNFSWVFPAAITLAKNCAEGNIHSRKRNSLRVVKFLPKAKPRSHRWEESWVRAWVWLTAPSPTPQGGYYTRFTGVTQRNNMTFPQSHLINTPQSRKNSSPQAANLVLFFYAKSLWWCNYCNTTENQLISLINENLQRISKINLRNRKSQ